MANCCPYSRCINHVITDSSRLCRCIAIHIPCIDHARWKCSTMSLHSQTCLSQRIRLHRKRMLAGMPDARIERATCALQVQCITTVLIRPLNVDGADPVNIIPKRAHSVFRLTNVRNSVDEYSYRLSIQAYPSLVQPKARQYGPEIQSFCYIVYAARRYHKVL